MEKPEIGKKVRDDWEIKQEAEENFLNHNYWKVPDQYNIEQLLE